MPKHSDLLSLSSVEMRRRIGSKEISPVELLEACIERIAEINPAVNAVTATCYARARREAKAAEKAVRDGETLGALQAISERTSAREVVAPVGFPGGPFRGSGARQAERQTGEESQQARDRARHGRTAPVTDG